MLLKLKVTIIPKESRNLLKIPGPCALQAAWGLEMWQLCSSQNGLLLIFFPEEFGTIAYTHNV